MGQRTTIARGLLAWWYGHFWAIFIIVTMAGIAAVVLMGLSEGTETSGTLHEDATVVNAIRTPSRHESRVEPSFSLGGDGMLGVGPSGVGIRVGSGVQITNVDVPETFAIVFRCRHGQFIVSKKEVYDKLKDHEGATVDVSYREVYRMRYDWTRPGKRVVIERTLAKYDFLDANVK